jgi:hypothetical protein
MGEDAERHSLDLLERVALVKIQPSKRFAMTTRWIWFVPS